MTQLVPSISPWNVWDLPICMWRAYAQLVDQHVAEVEKANAENRGR